MMATTHALSGVALGVALATAVPEVGPVALVAGVLGGVAPDLDVYAAHRRTLHAPVYGTGLAVAAVALVLLVPAPTTAALAAFLAAAALHAVMDAAGGGLSLEPWADQPERAVYSHYHSRWVPPRRWVRYDGSPEDLLLAAALGVPLLVLTTGLARWTVLALLCCSVVYVLLRKRLVGVLARVVAVVPASLSVLVPRRIDHLDE